MSLTSLTSGSTTDDPLHSPKSPQQHTMSFSPWIGESLHVHMYAATQRCNEMHPHLKQLPCRKTDISLVGFFVSAKRLPRVFIASTVSTAHCLSELWALLDSDRGKTWESVWQILDVFGSSASKVAS